MFNFGKAIIAILILLLLWCSPKYFRRGPIEHDLSAHVKAAFDLPEFSNVVVSCNGREGILSGSEDSQDLKEEAEKLAHKYQGVESSTIVLR